MFSLIKQVFTGLLTSIGNASNHTKCIYLNNQQCMTQSTLIILHPNEYGQVLRHYPYAINLDNTLNDLSYGTCVPNKTKQNI